MQKKKAFNAKFKNFDESSQNHCENDDETQVFYNLDIKIIKQFFFFFF